MTENTQTVSLNKNWAIDKARDEMVDAVTKIFYRNIPGDVAEFGTWNGNTAEYLAVGMALVDKAFEDKLHRQNSLGRKLHLFDSFVGLPASSAEEDLRTPAVIEGSWAPGTCDGVPPDHLRGMCTKFLGEDRVIIHEGWFKDTVPPLPDDTQFALVHIDCDLYASTMDVLDGLLGRGLLGPGAFLFFDDWDCNMSRPDVGERKAWADAVSKYNVEYSLSHPYAATGQAIIFHDCDATRARRA